MDNNQRRRGRPEIGGATRIRLGGLTEAVDAYAVEHELWHAGAPNRSEAVRQLVELGLTAERNRSD